MTIAKDYEWGDIVLINIPTVIGSTITSGRRPAIVVSNTSHNKTGKLITVIPLSSQTHKDRRQYIVIGKDNGLKKDSIAMTDQINTMDKEVVVCKIGKCQTSIMNKVLRTLDIHLGRVFAHTVEEEFNNEHR